MENNPGVRNLSASLTFTAAHIFLLPLYQLPALIWPVSPTSCQVLMEQDNHCYSFHMSVRVVSDLLNLMPFSRGAFIPLSVLEQFAIPVCEQHKRRPEALCGGHVAVFSFNIVLFNYLYILSI